MGVPDAKRLKGENPTERLHRIVQPSLPERMPELHESAARKGRDRGMATEMQRGGYQKGGTGRNNACSLRPKMGRKAVMLALGLQRSLLLRPTGGAAKATPLADERSA